MEYRNDDAGIRFTVIDRPTVRQQLAYFSEVANAEGKQVFLRYWAGAVELIEEWECKDFPDYETSLDEVTNPDIVQIVIWAGMRVMEFMNSLKVVPKN